MHSWKAPDIPAMIPASVRPRFYDSSTRELEASPEDSTASVLGLYVCGITPYDSTHIGHAATYIAFDLLNRLWRSLGYTVQYVQNVTDVDDPLLERATATNRDWTELAQEQIELFQEDMSQLRVLPPAHYLGAVETIPLVVTAVTRLIEDGYAYRVPVPAEERAAGADPAGDVYFDIARTPSFGEVSGYDHATMMSLFAERGGDPKRVGKRDPLDPLLWLSARKGDPAWPGQSLGPGRPGWHIECAVIAAEYLYVPFEVQGGGSDLIFPHHEMSAVHGEAICGVDTFANRFMHSGLVAFEGEKMSKSRGNLVFVSALRRAGIDPMAIRLAILGNHYRRDWEWTDAELARAELRLGRWRAVFESATDVPLRGADAVIFELQTVLADDLDAPSALNIIDAWVSVPGIQVSDGASNLDLARAIDALLGIV